MLCEPERGNTVTFFAFISCVVLSCLTLLLELRVRRKLRRERKTAGTRAILALWPLQVVFQLVVFALIASTRPVPKFPFHLQIAPRSGPGPFSPAFPPLHLQGKKERSVRL